MWPLRIAVVLVACGSPKQPAATNDLDPPPQRSTATPVDDSVDARPPESVADASIDASVAAAADPMCADDVAAKQACQSMGRSFAPRMVTPCPRAGGPGPMKEQPRCMCVDVTKPRDCAAKK